MQVTKSMASGDDMVVKSLSVPIGLEELMEGLTKEVLLKRPADVYAFASEYFERLLGMRETGCYRGRPPKQVRTVTKKTVSAKATRKPDTTATKLVLTGSNVAAQNKPNAKSKILENRRSRRTISDEDDNKKPVKKVKQLAVEKRDKMTQKPSIDEGGKMVDVSPRTAHRNYKNVQSISEGEKGQKQDKGKELQTSPRGAIKKETSPRKSKETMKKEKGRGTTNVDSKDKSSGDGKTNKKKSSPRDKENLTEKTLGKGKQLDRETKDDLVVLQSDMASRQHESKEKEIAEQDASEKQQRENKKVLDNEEKADNVTQQDISNVEVNTKVNTIETKQQKQLEDNEQHASNTLKKGGKDFNKDDLKVKKIKGDTKLKQQQKKTSLNSDPVQLESEIQKTKNDDSVEKELDKHKEITNTIPANVAQNKEAIEVDKSKPIELERHHKEAAIDSHSNNIDLKTQETKEETARLVKELEKKQEKVDIKLEKTTQNIQTTKVGDKTMVKKSDDREQNKLETEKIVPVTDSRNESKDHQESKYTDSAKVIQNVQVEAQNENRVEESEKHEEGTSINSNSIKTELKLLKPEDKSETANKMQELQEKTGTTQSRKIEVVEEITRETKKNQKENSVSETVELRKQKTENEENQEYSKNSANVPQNTKIEANDKEEEQKLEKQQEQKVEREASGSSEVESKMQKVKNDLQRQNEMEQNVNADLSKANQNSVMNLKEKIEANQEKVSTKSIKSHQSSEMEVQKVEKKNESKTSTEVTKPAQNTEKERIQQETQDNVKEANKQLALEKKKEDILSKEKELKDEHINDSLEALKDNAVNSQKQKLKNENKPTAATTVQDGENKSGTKLKPANQKENVEDLLVTSKTENNQDTDQKAIEDKDDKPVLNKNDISNKNEVKSKGKRSVDTENGKTIKEVFEENQLEASAVKQDIITTGNKLTVNGNLQTSEEEHTKSENLENTIATKKTQGLAVKAIPSSADVENKTQSIKTETIITDKKLLQDFIAAERLETVPEKPVSTKQDVASKTEIQDHAVKGDLADHSKKSANNPETSKSSKVSEDDKNDLIKTSAGSVKEIKTIQETNKINSATSKDGLDKQSVDSNINHLQEQIDKTSEESKNKPEKEVFDKKQSNTSKSEERKKIDVVQNNQIDAKDTLNEIKISESDINKEDLKLIPTKPIENANNSSTKILDLSHSQEATSNKNKTNAKLNAVILAEEIKKPVAIVEALNFASKSLDDKSKNQTKPKLFKSPSETIQPLKLDRLDKSKSFDFHTTFPTKTPPPTPISSEKSQKESVDMKTVTSDLLEAEKNASTVQKETQLVDYTTSYSPLISRQEINNLRADETKKTEVEKEGVDIKQNATINKIVKEENCASVGEKLSTGGDEKVDKKKIVSEGNVEGVTSKKSTVDSKEESKEIFSKGITDKKINALIVTEKNEKQDAASNKETKTGGAVDSKKESGEVSKTDIAETQINKIDVSEDKIDRIKEDKTAIDSADNKEKLLKATVNDEKIKETGKNQKEAKVSPNISVTKNEDADIKEKDPNAIPEKIVNDKINERTLINKELAAVIKIQSLFRGFLARNKLQTKTKSLQQNETVTSKLLTPLQAGTKSHDLSFQKEVAAALTIQKFWKKFLKKKRRLKQQSRKEIGFERQVRAAITLQKFWKKIISRKHEAATKIQANVRGYLVRKDVKNLPDSEIEAALKKLDTIEVPSESPKRKNELIRSATVEEPAIEKKHVTLLGKSQSIGGFLFGPSSASISDFKIKKSAEECKNQGVEKNENKLALREINEENVELKKTDQLVEKTSKSKENAPESVTKVTEIINKPEIKPNDVKPELQEQEKKADIEHDIGSHRIANEITKTDNDQVEETSKQPTTKENKKDDKKTEEEQRHKALINAKLSDKKTSKQMEIKLTKNQEQYAKTPKDKNENQGKEGIVVEVKASKEETQSRKVKETLAPEEIKKVETKLQPTMQDKYLEKQKAIIQLNDNKAEQVSDKEKPTSTVIESKEMRSEFQKTQQSTKTPRKEEKTKETETDKEKQVSDKEAIKLKMVKNKQASIGSSEKEKADNKRKSQNNKSRNNLVEKDQTKPEKKTSAKMQKRRLEKSKSEEKTKINTMKTSSFDISQLRKEIEEASNDSTKETKASTTFNKTTSKTKEPMHPTKTSDTNNNNVGNSKLQRSTTFTYEDMLERETPPKTLSLKEVTEEAAQPKPFCGTNHIDYETAPTRPVTSDDVETFTKERPLSMDSSTSADSVVTVVPKIDDERKADILVIPEEEDLAATKIQATYRGHRVRRDLKQNDGKSADNDTLKDDLIENKEVLVKKHTNNEAISGEPESNQELKEEQKSEKHVSSMEQENQELDDQILAIKHVLKAATESVDKNLAATKIQSTYRGHRVRMGLKNELLKDIDETPELETQKLLPVAIPSKEAEEPSLEVTEGPSRSEKDVQPTNPVTNSLETNSQDNTKTFDEVKLPTKSEEEEKEERSKAVKDMKATPVSSLPVCSKKNYLVDKEASKTEEVKQSDNKRASSDTIKLCEKNGAALENTENIGLVNGKFVEENKGKNDTDENLALTKSETIVDKTDISSKRAFSEDNVQKSAVEHQQLKADAILNNTSIEDLPISIDNTNTSSKSEPTAPKQNAELQDKSLMKVKEPETGGTLNQLSPQNSIESNDLKLEAVNTKLSHTDKAVTRSESFTSISKPSEDVLPKDASGSKASGADTKPTSPSASAKDDGDCSRTDKPVDLGETHKSFSESDLKCDKTAVSRKQETGVTQGGIENLSSSEDVNISLNQTDKVNIEASTDTKSSNGLFESDNIDQTVRKSAEDSCKIMQNNVAADAETNGKPFEKSEEPSKEVSVLQKTNKLSTEKENVSQTFQSDAKLDKSFDSLKDSSNEVNQGEYKVNKTLKSLDGNSKDETSKIASQTNQVVYTNDNINEKGKTSVVLPSVDTQIYSKIDEKTELSDHAKSESKDKLSTNLTQSSIPSDSKMDERYKSSNILSIDSIKLETKNDSSGDVSQALIPMHQTDSKANGKSKSSDHIPPDDTKLQTAATDESSKNPTQPLDTAVKCETSAATDEFSKNPTQPLDTAAKCKNKTNEKCNSFNKMPAASTKSKNKSSEILQSDDNVCTKSTASLEALALASDSPEQATTNESSSNVTQPPSKVIQSSKSKTVEEGKSSNNFPVDEEKLEAKPKEESLETPMQSSGTVLAHKLNIDQNSKTSEISLASDTKIEAKHESSNTVTEVSTQIPQGDVKTDKNSKSSNTVSAASTKFETEDQTSKPSMQSSIEMSKSNVKIDEQSESSNILSTDDAKHETKDKLSKTLSTASIKTNQSSEKLDKNLPSFNTASEATSKFGTNIESSETLLKSSIKIVGGDTKTDKKSTSLDKTGSDIQFRTKATPSESSLQESMEISQADSIVNTEPTSSAILNVDDSKLKSSESLLQASMKTLGDSKMDETHKYFDIVRTDNIMAEIKDKSSEDSTQPLMQIFVSDGKMDEKTKSSDGKDGSLSEEASKVNSSEQSTEADPKTSTTSKPPSPNLVYTGELQEGAIPLAVPLDQSSAGTKELTSPTERRRRRLAATATTHARLKTIDDGDAAGDDDDQSAAHHFSVEMEQQKKRVNSSLVKNKNVEAEAATKIQASFRGYQVRKQLKQKNGSGDIKINQRRHQNKRKSSGSLSETLHDPGTRKQIEERSATKIQAGIRGFLVRKRQKNAKKSPAEAS